MILVIHSITKKSLKIPHFCRSIYGILFSYRGCVMDVLKCVQQRESRVGLEKCQKCVKILFIKLADLLHSLLNRALF